MYINILNNVLQIIKISNMYNLLFSFALIVSMATVSAASPNNNSPSSVKFYEGDFNEALSIASSNGKLLLVDFYANWCTPCKWMEKTTFRDQGVSTLLNDNYIVYKADIDTKEGFNSKEKYNVSVLPTMLIFNTKGELVERIEETMTADKFVPLLEFHNHPQNKLKIIHSFNMSPEQYNRPTQSAESLEWQKTYEAYQSMQNSKSFYRLQIAVYEDSNLAFKQVNELRDQFYEPIVVLNDSRDGKQMYKVMMGKFSTMDEAEGFKEMLTLNYQMNSIVY